MTTVGPGKETAFFDDFGVRWTVVPVPAGRVLGAAPVGLAFTSEDGERRVANGFPPECLAWDGVDDAAWRELLREAVSVM
jgi:hypothetical protein